MTSLGTEVLTGFNGQPLDVLVVTSDELALLASDLPRCPPKITSNFGSGKGPLQRMDPGRVELD